MNVQQCCYEALIWKTLKHERLLSLSGIIKTDQDYFMISSWQCDGDSGTFLRDMIQNHERYRWGRFYQLLVYRWVRVFTSSNCVQRLKHCLVHIVAPGGRRTEVFAPARCYTRWFTLGNDTHWATDIELIPWLHRKMSLSSTLDQMTVATWSST